jgi:hypothetical protein
VQPAMECQPCVAGMVEDKNAAYPCACVNIDQDKIQGQLMLSTWYQHQMNTVIDYHEFKAGSMITFRQIAVDGEWPFPVEFKDGEVPAMFEGMKCLDIDSHFSNDVYGQIVFKAQDVTEQCNWDLTFKNEANGNFLTFNMKVVPLD